jgi:2-methylcitrate dehydratase PrpD
MASGINEFHADGSQAKQLHLGWAAHSGILAVQFAEEGATGPESVLEGAAGVFASFAGASIDKDAVLDGIGERYHLAEISPKPYPACHCIHAVVDAWRELSQQLDLTEDLESIESITCLVPEWYVEIVLEPRAIRMDPPTIYAARFSLPFCLAKTVIDGNLELASFSRESIHDPQVRNLMERIDYEVKSFDEFPAYFPGGIRVKLRNGGTYERVVRHNRGSDMDPLTAKETVAKLEEAGRLIGEDSASDRVVSAIRSLSDADDLSSLQVALAGFESPFCVDSRT